MAAHVIVLKSKEKQGTIMTTSTINGQIPTSACGQNEEQVEIMATWVEDGQASNSKFIGKDSRTLGG